jgi:hypothetical protein
MITFVFVRYVKFIKRVRKYGPGKLFAYVLTIMCIATLTFDQWTWTKVVTLPWVQCKKSVKYSNPCFQWNLWPRQCWNHYEHSDLDLWLITLEQGHDISLCPGQQSCEILFKFIKRVRSYGPDKLFAYVLTIMCIVTLTSDLGSRPWHFLGSSVTILWNIIPIHAFSKNLWARTMFTPLWA